MKIFSIYITPLPLRNAANFLPLFQGSRVVFFRRNQFGNGFRRSLTYWKVLFVTCDL